VLPGEVHNVAKATTLMKGISRTGASRGVLNLAFPALIWSQGRLQTEPRNDPDRMNKFTSRWFAFVTMFLGSACGTLLLQTCCIPLISPGNK